MKVLIISANTLPAAPTGPVYVAGAVREAGHEVQIYERMFAKNLAEELTARIDGFQPDVIGVSIRLVFDDEIVTDAPLGTWHTDLRPRVKEITDVVRRISKAPIVLGGPGFNYYARDWLEYLDLDYGIRGEGEESFPLYLRRVETGDDVYSVPGCVYRKDGTFYSVAPRAVQDLTSQALPAYDLVDWRPYNEVKITPAILSKRGCSFSCTYCPYSRLEGKRYRMKTPQRIIAESRKIIESTNINKVMFCDNNFNVPRRHAEAICKELLARKADFQWGTGDLRPMGLTNDFCRLMEESGCFYVNLSIESASEVMLTSMKRGYTVQQVRESLDAVNRTKIPFSASLMLGAPGETPETIAETLRLLDDYEIPNGVWVTIGVYLWTDYQDIVVDLQNSGSFGDKKELFNGAVYLSPGLPKSYLRELPERLRARHNYYVQFNKLSESWTL